ncbi:6,7-dimethyl-8-ribityllumazine synthase [Paralcaligenes sp. KSB-10]|jgi:6,7-dimethyl-8-ribityllumazine synthase|uniref:6,7-dimethyl-8-ribityllumazine synthase n=1 Tax=Paralcaligenes sp. KSB-10 TaxID=2901142 RepID=UPI001E4CC054|nr:6,7-dimethyl-8-ribityllumazine synthase [Paralcaligenes sp. KSB-10]UHL65926.1 6,7-dimethyl-8-ribityllumazine synthase [Paralcaligenes sp. KSB-10]
MYSHRVNLTPGAARIAFVQSCWHREIVDQCRLGFIDELNKLAAAEYDIDFFEVAGAFEIPLQAKRLAQNGRYRAVVAAGLVVDGGIYRHEFVAQAVVSGLMQVQLELSVPVISAVLTPQHFNGQGEHIGFFREHFLVKGAEAARACVETVERLRQLDRTSVPASCGTLPSEYTTQ